MKSTNLAPAQPETWAEDVFRAGRQNPWRDRKRLKHETVFAPNAVLTDGMGNVLDMPILRAKWCFGRPEVYVRQAGQKKTISFHWGQKEVPSTRCGSCPISKACAKLAGERIDSSAKIRDALEAWRQHCNAIGGEREFSGPAGRLWQGFLQAIADHGGWKSTNDKKLREEAKKRTADNLRKDSRRKQLERERDRDLRRAFQSPPDRDVVRAILDERNRRCELLEQAAGTRASRPR